MHTNGSINRVYRLIWSDVRNCWVAVEESGRGRGKGTSSKLIAAALSLSAVFAQAGPSGGQVVSGSGSVTQSGTTTTIQQASQNMSLDWKSFNIASQETVNFVQPSASAIAVNRIFDTSGTKILGRLNANGQVYLINPDGILFGQGAHVNVGGLVASTLDFNDASLNGTTRSFSGNGTGSIVNLGTINATGSGGTGGYVALVGNTVSNQGTIMAPLGTVALGAGSAATLIFQNNSLVKMQVDQSVLNSLAENGGLIRADGGMVVLSAGAKDALLASVVNNTGVIEARTVQEHNGTIILLGSMAAGTTYVSGTLDASSPNGGNGGFIETSAAIVKVADDTRVTTSAPAGITGTWLIDPTNFTIAAGSGASTTIGIGATTLSSNLGSGNVSIATSATGSEAGDIFVNSAVSWSANKLTLSAHRNININANLNASNMASLALDYGQGAVAAGNTSQITTTGAVVNLPAGTSNFTTRQGSDGTTKAYTVITSLGAAASTTATDLQGMNGAPAANYALGSNIDAAPTSTAAFGTTGFAPISTFAGTFDGLGHTVSGLFINAGTTANTGLFGLVGSGAAIRNVGLLGGSVTGGAGTGALVGYNGIGSAVHNSYATGNVTGAAGTGGLIGSNTTGAITNSYATGNVTGAAGTGGLLGSNTTGAITNSYATGNVNNGAAASIGGLLGAGTTGAITNSYATGSVTGGAGAGGLVGDITTGNITNSYAIGAVSGNAGAGGLVGTITTGAITNTYATGSVAGAAGTGGLVGVGTTGVITNSYATGLITGAGAGRGGLIGTTGAAHVGSFWDTQTTGMATSLGGAGVKGMTTAQMKDPLNFTTANGNNGNANPAWNTASTWTLNSVNYPLLTSLLSNVATVTADNRTQTYQGAAFTSGYTASTVFAPGFSGPLSGTATFSGNSQTEKNAGSYVITTSGLSYGGSNNPQNVVSFANGTLTIGKAKLSVTADNKSRLYGAANPALSTTVSGFVNGESAGTAAGFTGAGSATTAASATTNAGTAAITGSTGTLAASNYDFAATNGTFTIGKANAVVTANSDTSKTYTGVSQSVSGFTASGLVNGETASVLSGVSARGSGTNAGSYNVVASGTDSNYNLSLNNGTLTIAPAPVSISGVRAYDGSTTLAANIFSLSGLVSGQDLTFSGSGSMANQNVGIGKPVSSLGTLALSNGNVGLSSNYTLVGGTGQVQVNAAALTITAGTISKTYDGTLAVTGTGNVTSGSLFGTDTLSSSGLAFTDKNVGNRNKTVTANGVSVLDGNGGANYQVSYVSNTTSTIDPRALNVIAQAADKIYDGKTTASVALSDNRIAGDVLTLSLKPSLTGSPTSGTYISMTGTNGASTQIVSGSSGSYISITDAEGTSTQIVSGSSGANFADKNVGVGKTVYVVGIQVQGTDAGNYTANTTALSTATITPKALTVVAAGQNKVYDGTITNALILSSSGVVRGDNLLLNGSGTFADANAGTAKAVVVTGIAASGGDIGNYSLSNTTASTTANITPKIITVTASGTDKVYDGSTTSGVVNLSSSGVLQQDLHNVQFNAASAFTNKNVGVRKIVAVSNISASGNQSGNYQVKNSTATAYATVTAKNIVVAARGSDKVYDGSTKGVVNLSSDGVLSGDAVNFANTSAVFADKNVGDGKAVTVSGIRLTGTDAGNYTNNASASSSANITPKSIAVTATGSSMVYNATRNVPVTLTSSGVLRGDSVSFTNTSALLDNKNVGTDKLVTVSGISALGGDARNYALSNSTATARATVTPLSITVTANGVNKAFDGTTNGTVSLQSLGVIDGDLLSFASTSAKFANSAVGVNKVVTVSGVIPFDADGMNYRVVNKTVTTGATITPN